MEPASLIEPNPNPAPDGGNQPPADGGAPAPALTRPDGLPDEYWDPKAGMRTGELVKRFGELNEFHTAQTKHLSEIPEKAEDAGKYYTLPEKLLPDDVKLPDGMTFQLDDKHPMLAPAIAVAHKHKLPAAAFQELAQVFAAADVREKLAFNEALGKEAQKLGANADTRKKAVSDFLTGHLGDKAEPIISNIFTAAQVEAYETLITKFSAQNNVVPLHSKRDETPEEAPPAPGARIFTSMRA